MRSSSSAVSCVSRTPSSGASIAPRLVGRAAPLAIASTTPFRRRFAGGFAPPCCDDPRRRVSPGVHLLCVLPPPEGEHGRAAATLTAFSDMLRTLKQLRTDAGVRGVHRRLQLGSTIYHSLALTRTGARHWLPSLFNDEGMRLQSEAAQVSSSERRPLRASESKSQHRSGVRTCLEARPHPKEGPLAIRKPTALFWRGGG
ncbi:hypothetical protein AB1Y20_014723 [Prymnesium parvum]|uniref:Uncharacterized protein n=1 Tax=Prymnesium parvum TaxID=97485 RepID=A0AB34ICX3_PRYPA